LGLDTVADYRLLFIFFHRNMIDYHAEKEFKGKKDEEGREA
jgi:hypothetical protein